MKKVLVIGGHPDDEMLGAGGTLARHAAEGDAVYVVIFGDGVSARYDKYDRKVEKEVKDLEKDFQSACKILGVRKGEVLGYKGNLFDEKPLLFFVKQIMGYIEKIKPDVIYTHSSAELNVDHYTLYKATVTACRPVWQHRPSEILCFELPSSTEWNAPSPQNAFIPSVYVDIDKTLNKKLEAMRAYKGEIKEFPHPRSIDYLTSLARKRGAEVGLKAAEAFMPVRIVR